MNYKLCFEINELPKTTNSLARMHWRVKGKYVRHWHDMVWALVVSKKPKEPIQRAKLTLTRFSSTEPDFDGLVSSFKACIDALVVHGVLENDRISNVGQPAYLWEKCKPKMGRIRVVVEEQENL